MRTLRPTSLTIATALASAVAAALTPALATPGSAAPPAERGTGIVTLDSAGSTSRPDVVVDPDGTATVVWSRDGRVVTRSRVGGAWRPPVTLGRGYAPRGGADAQGSLTVIWLRHRPGFGPQVMAARHPVTSDAWTEPRAVSAPAPAVSSARGAYSPTLVVSGAGSVVVTWLWNQEDSGAARVQARFRPAGGPWQPVATLSGADARNPVAAIDRAGRATVAYVGRRARPRAVTHTRQGWGSPVRLSSHGANTPQVAAGAADDVVVTFAASIDQAYQPQAVVRPPGGPWSAPVSLEVPTAPLTALDPVVAVDANGGATAAWWRSDNSIAAATHARHGSWLAPEVVVPAGPRILPLPPYVDLSVGPSGTALLAWTGRVGGETSVSAAVRRGASWAITSPVSALDQGCAAPQTDVRAGTVVLAWRCGGNAQDLVQVVDLTP